VKHVIPDRGTGKEILEEFYLLGYNAMKPAEFFLLSASSHSFLAWLIL
jgi:hypothetical protein